MKWFESFYKNDQETGRDIEEGDMVIHKDSILKRDVRYPAKVTKVRHVNGGEGNAISLFGHTNEYWSIYLKKC